MKNFSFAEHLKNKMIILKEAMKDRVLNNQNILLQTGSCCARIDVSGFKLCPLPTLIPLTSILTTPPGGLIAA